MKAIYKYDVRSRTHMPKGAKIIYVGGQHNNVRIWAEVDPYAETEVREFVIKPTGGTVPDEGEYIGTVIMHHDEVVMHVYELPNAESLPRSEQT